VTGHYLITLRENATGERVQREHVGNIAEALTAYPPSHFSLVEVRDLEPQVGLVGFTDGTRYDGRDRRGAS
jgi:hypothetical protein